MICIVMINVETPILSLHLDYVVEVIATNKKIEYRSWKTSYRGLLLLHSTRIPYQGTLELEEKILKIEKEKPKDPYKILTSEEGRTLDALNIMYDMVDDEEDKMVSTIWCVVDLQDITKGENIYEWHINYLGILKNPIHQVKGKLGLWRAPSLLEPLLPLNYQF